MRSIHVYRKPLTVTVLAATAIAAVVACATNPVTGKRELSLISGTREIEIGREGARDITRSIGVYDDADLQRYVSDLGKKLAAKSERPDLPWSFRVVDDAAVNAFALPGGFIFVTRGILAHMNSEGQLVAVLGHEIGHVTARHSVSQISKAQLTQLGLGLGFVLSEDFREFGELASAGVGLLFLKFGRDDENQSDELGFRYAVQSGYDPREMVRVFETLESVSARESTERLPQWQSTHPNPQNRIARTQSRIDTTELPSSGLRVGRNDYLARLDGMIFGSDPRKGYFKEEVFFHPELKFRFVFPAGWKTRNGISAVVAVSPKEDGAVELTLAGEEEPAEASRKFLTQEGMVAGTTSADPINGLAAASAHFEMTTERGRLVGWVTFVSLDSRTYRLLGHAAEVNEPRYRDTFRASLKTFERLTDRAALAVTPARLEMVVLDRDLTLEEFYRRYPSTVPLETIALINGRAPGDRLTAGMTIKPVTAGELPV